jgi:hypothetical protein
MADNIWKQGKLLVFADRLAALCYMASGTVHECEFVNDLSAVGGTYQLY